MPTLKILKIRLLTEVEDRKHKNVYILYLGIIFTNKSLKNNFKLKKE